MGWDFGVLGVGLGWVGMDGMEEELRNRYGYLGRLHRQACYE